MAASVTATILITPLSRVIDALLGNFFGRYNIQHGKTLDTFLKTLSVDFVNRVENIVRDAFTEQNLLEVKTALRTAVTAFRTFTTSESQDISNLEVACLRVLDARSRLMTTIDGILKLDPNRFMAFGDPAQKGAAVVQHNKTLEASMAALQAVAAIDLLVLSRKIEKFRTIAGEIAARVDEYCHYADELKQEYLNHQSLRSWVKWNHNIKFFGAVGNCWFICHRYVDGVIVNKHESRLFDVHFLRVENEKREFERPLIQKYGQDFALYEAAKQKVSSSDGNIEEAVKIWAEVKAFYAR